MLQPGVASICFFFFCLPSLIVFSRRRCAQRVTQLWQIANDQVQALGWNSASCVAFTIMLMDPYGYQGWLNAAATQVNMSFFFYRVDSFPLRVGVLGRRYAPDAAQCRCLVRAAGLLGGDSFLCCHHGAFPSADACRSAGASRAGGRVGGSLRGYQHWLRRGVAVRGFEVFLSWVHSQTEFPFIRLCSRGADAQLAVLMTTLFNMVAALIMLITVVGASAYAVTVLSPNPMLFPTWQEQTARRRMKYLVRLLQFTGEEGDPAAPLLNPFAVVLCMCRSCLCRVDSLYVGGILRVFCQLCSIGETD